MNPLAPLSMTTSRSDARDLADHQIEPGLLQVAGDGDVDVLHAQAAPGREGLVRRVGVEAERRPLQVIFEVLR